MLAEPPAMQKHWASLRRAAPAPVRGVPRRLSEDVWGTQGGLNSAYLVSGTGYPPPRRLFVPT